MNPNIVTGKYTGNGSAINVILGFVPDYLRIVNITDGTTAWEWFSGMAAGSAFQNTNNAATQNSVISANGVTAYEGEDGAGFTVGTALSTNAKEYRFVATRNGAGGSTDDHTPPAG